METGFLGQLWWVSLALAAASLVIVTLLILFRLLGSYGDRQRDLTRKQIIQSLHAIMNGADGDLPRLSQLLSQTRVGAQAVLELSTLIRGEAFDAAVAALESVGFEKRLLRLSRSQNGAERQAAIDALGYIGGPAATQRLAQIANRNGDIEHRIAAVRALQNRGDPIDMGAVAEALSLIGNRLPGEFEAVLDRLAREAPERLERLLDRPDLPTLVYIQGLRSLGDSGHLASLPLIQRMAAHPEAEIRAAAIAAMGALGHPAAKDAIQQGLRSPHEIIRIEAARAAGQISLKNLQSELVPLLDDRNWDVRFNAARSLNLLGEEGRSVLQRAAGGDAESRSARTAQMVLAESGGPA